MEPKWHLSGPKPYEVQLEALRRSSGHDRYGYLMDMGLGKSALTLNDYAENFSDYDTVIVVCPQSFKKDWTLLPQEWGLSHIQGGMWPHDEMKKGTTANPRFNVINFESIRSSGYYAIKELMDKRPCLMIVDESSAIKNFKSDTSKAILDLSKRTKAMRILNGTPMSQNVMDIFPQLKVLGELQGMNPYAFRNRFAIMGGWMGKQVTGVKNEAELHEILNRCSFRALKEDWSDLPEKVEVPIRLEMTNKQLKHYREMLVDFYTMVSGEEFSAPMVLAQQEKLRQVASGILIDGDKHILIEDPINNPKIKASLDLMESGASKMIIVHFYRVMGEHLFNSMKKKGLNPSYIRGGMTPDELQDQKTKFNTDPTCRVKIAQIKASNESHTLIGGSGNDRCNRMFFHDCTFNLRDFKQMQDRIHRGAQDRVCLYYLPILSAIDEAQIKALTKKQDMVRVVVDAVRATRGRV